jgi:hypothetical protein
MIDHDKNRLDPTLRACDECKKRKPREFGSYWKFNNGLNQKWLCKSCFDLRNHRL